MRDYKNARGFTLIELMLAIAIIGLIASIFVVGQSNTTVAKRDVKRYADMKELQQALSLYEAKTQTYPVYDGCLDGADPVNAGLRAQAVVTADANFIDPLNPSDTANCYYYVGTPTTYTVRYTIEKNSSVGPAGEYNILP